PPLRLPRRSSRDPLWRVAGEEPPPGDREGRVGHAPQEPPRSEADQEAEGLCGPRSPARGPAAHAVHHYQDLAVTPGTTRTERRILVAESTVETPDTNVDAEELDVPPADPETGIAYTSETAPSVTATADRPATIAPAIATGRRKEAVARVRIVPGSGQWSINGRTLEEYFPNKVHQQHV